MKTKNRSIEKDFKLGPEKQEYVVLLHGIVRTYRCMRPLEKALMKAGFHVVNIDYPARKQNVQKTADDVYKLISPLCNIQNITIHFVTHSMGGLVIRQLLNQYSITNIDKIVMLGPPNQGSEVADFLKNNFLYQKVYGPAGQQLTTSKAKEDPFPRINLRIGVIAGTKCLDPFCYFLLPKPHDGKVTVESTKIENMQDHIQLPVTHSFMMYNKNVISQTLQFLRKGHFQR